MKPSQIHPLPFYLSIFWPDGDHTLETLHSAEDCNIRMTQLKGMSFGERPSFEQSDADGLLMTEYTP